MKSLRVQLLGRIQNIYKNGKLTESVFNDLIRIPGRVIHKVADNALYLNGDCVLKVQNRALHVRFLNVESEKNEDSWNRSDVQQGNLVLYFPISRVVEYGILESPPC